MKVYEAIAEACVAEGVDTIFTLMGDSTMHCLLALDDRGVRIIETRHESGAVAMADGYARATGRIGVASTTCGPGLTQIGTQLMVASRGRSPIVVFVGDTPMRADNHIQDMDQRRFIEACEALYQPIRSADTAAADTAAAFERARRERRPVVLNAPKDIQLDDYPWDWHHTPSTASIPRPQRQSPAQEIIDEAAGIIAGARRPVVVAGRGAMESGAQESTLQLARQIGALTATTLLAKGFLDEDEFCVGVSGAFSSAVAEELFTEADLVIAIGASLNYYTTEGGLIFPEARYVWINAEQFPRQGARTDDYLLQGDADTIVRALLSALGTLGYANDGFRTTEVSSRFVPWAGAQDPLPDGIEPREAVRIIDKYVGDEYLVVLGIGHYWSFPIQYLHGPRHGGFIFTHQFGAIGQCLSSAVGVAAGRPDRRVIAFEGDGSFMMHVQELESAARNGIPLLVVILNDEALGAELHHLEAEGIEKTKGSVQKSPLMADMARAFGCNGATVTTLGELEAAWQDYENTCDRPFLLDIRISRSVADPYRKLSLGMANAAPHQGRVAMAMASSGGVLASSASALN